MAESRSSSNASLCTKAEAPASKARRRTFGSSRVVNTEYAFRVIRR